MFTFKKPNIRGKNPLNIGGLVCLSAAVYAIYYILVQDILPFSIASIIDGSSQHAKKWHILTIGLMPIYLGFVIFGTAVISLYVGSTLQHWLIRRHKKL